MTTLARAVAGVGLLLFATGCYRTTYMNLTPPEKLDAARATPVTHPPNSTWQHFFIWGWVPGEKVISTEQACGGTDRVESIHTERTFLQGLVAILSSYYINIYSPWTGRVACAGDPPQH